jgi:hypothetical protein
MPLRVISSLNNVPEASACTSRKTQQALKNGLAFAALQTFEGRD